MAEQETIFDRWAKERGITVAEMKAIISARIERGLNDPDPDKRMQWSRIPCNGKVPTPEEWLQYAVERLIEEGGEDFLNLPFDMR